MKVDELEVGKIYEMRLSTTSDLDYEMYHLVEPIDQFWVKVIDRIGLKIQERLRSSLSRYNFRLRYNTATPGDPDSMGSHRPTETGKPI